MKTKSASHIQDFATRASFITSLYEPGEERNIIETHATNLKERLIELDELVCKAPSFKKCGHDSTLATFWCANVPDFIACYEAEAGETLDTVHWGDAIFPGTHPNNVSYDCITLEYGGYWCVGSGMQSRAYPAPGDRTEDCPECLIPWWVGAGWMELRKSYVAGELGVGLEELTFLFCNCVRSVVASKRR
jgi:hypothetical protein